jgi:NAD(P)-dependent dehydrogenase (short-subunit alcohol dehydrogenase family)
LRRDTRSVFAVLSARVGSITDNRLGGWHSYRASKAALNMLVRNFAIELTARNPQAIAIAIHPGTVDTSLSKPFQRSLPDGCLFQPDQSATQILSVIDKLSAADSGSLFAWNGEQIPF